MMHEKVYAKLHLRAKLKDQKDVLNRGTKGTDPGKTDIVKKVRSEGF